MNQLEPAYKYLK